MRWLLWVIRGAGVLLVASAAFKIADREAVASAFVHYGLPQGLGLPATLVLCVIEFALGAWAVAMPRAASPAIMLVFTAFAGWHAAMAVLMGDDGACPCMGLSLFGKAGPQAWLAPGLLAVAASAFVVAARFKRPVR